MIPNRRPYSRTILITILVIVTVLVVGTIQAQTNGPVTTENSVTGSGGYDHIGSGGVYVLPSGNIVIASPNWGAIPGYGGGIGAVTCLTPAEYKAGGIVVSYTNSR